MHARQNKRAETAESAFSRSWSLDPKLTMWAVFSRKESLNTVNEIPHSLIAELNS
jgi:hypothetical protein